MKRIFNYESYISLLILYYEVSHANSMAAWLCNAYFEPWITKNIFSGNYDFRCRPDKIYFRIISLRGHSLPTTIAAATGPASTGVAGGETKAKKKGFRAETAKRLSPRSKYYCFSHSRAFRIRKFFLSANHGGRQYFSVFHGPPTLKSISPVLSYDFSLHFFHDFVIICLSVSHIQIHLLTLLDNFVNSLRWYFICCNSYIIRIAWIILNW